MDNNIVIERILNLLDEKNMSKTELARKCKWSMPKMSKVLSNNQKINTEELITIAYALNTNPALLIANNVNDVIIHEKQTIPLNIILSNIRNCTDEDILDSLINIELVDTIKSYLSLNETGKKIKTFYKSRDGKGIRHPRVVIYDTSEGQIFRDFFTMGYWFDEKFSEVSIAINYARTFSSASERDRVSVVKVSDMKKIFESIKEVNDYTEYNVGAYLKPGPMDPYERGMICSIKYDLSEMLDEGKLKIDLVKIYEYYLKLLELATQKIQETAYQLYQMQRERAKWYNQTEKEEEFGITDLSDMLAEPIARIKSTSMRHKIFEQQGYLCEIDENHHTFMEGNTGKPYMQVEHIIPISNQKDFNEALDVIENCCCVCPTCAAKLRYGTDEDRQEMLVKLYDRHKEGLRKQGINTTLLQLFKYHGMK